MYSTLNLYYLNQLGITPWINNEIIAPVTSDSAEIKHQNIPLVIIMKQPQLSKKAEILLNKMIAYLNLGDSDVFITENLQHSSFVKNDSPKAVLSLGIESSALVDTMMLKCPFLFAPSPEQLISNPLEKREILKVLNSIKLLVN
ncbi:DNA polymerase III subunit psi [Legionella worsleiensis]|uniref:DNA polymerase III subunit psi n=1 Tax=Legionella worsleiensis TaxID=45076 RepID=A0A0W1A6J8_9GAMM|nr:DNA polymerase III subunit psi [Legionella worsleiensis]KTD76932.1 hypothetical protein Lwor_2157 [Legionella worsleiensis]STY33397.1 Uncharacterised protein [Legionella worsleiensis]